ncbi:MAG: hypothetical protein IJL87_03095, partial [Clostridia bacterium]|nr:hypothetical protein [Clostridia bacterium]
MRKNIKKIIIDCACALLSALGIGYLAGLTGFESTLLLLLFPALYMLEKKINAFEKIDNRFAFFALMLAFALFIGRYCEGKIQFGVKWVFFLLFVSKAIYNAAVIIYIKSEKFTSEPYDNKANLKCFFSYWAFIFAAWIPYFTASFPGVISYDSVRQIEMAQGNIPLSDHHPVLHTMIIKLFLKLGGGSPALYVVFQMLALSACFAFAANYVKSKAILPKWGIILTVCWFALNPLHAVFSINIQKDTLFAGAIVLLTVVLCEVSLTNGNALEDKKWFSLLIVSCILTVFLRNNGPYVVVLLLPVLFVFYKKYRKQISEAFAVAIVLFLIVKIGVFGALDVQKGSFAESVGIPLQQISRVVYDGKELTDKQIETLEQFISVEEIKEKYVPDCVDPLKSDLYDGGLDHQALEQNKGQFFGLWFQLLLKYPGEYIKAYADETLGY